MKAITEEILRYELRNSQPEVYVIPEGKILTPAAREYLQQRKIRFQREGSFQEIRKTAEPEKTEKPKIVATPVPESEPVKVVVQQPEKPKYEDYETGAFYYEKPEHMTQLFGNKLVTKDHPRILFRGKLDSLQSLVVLDQALICASSGCGALVQDLGDILKHNDVRSVTVVQMESPCCRDLKEYVRQTVVYSHLPVPVQIATLFLPGENLEEDEEYVVRSTMRLHREKSGADE